jgi:hypothetical protein
MQYTLHILALQWRSHIGIFLTSKFAGRQTRTAIWNSSAFLSQRAIACLFLSFTPGVLSVRRVEIQLKSRVKPRHWAHCILLAQVSSKLHKRESNDAAGERKKGVVSSLPWCSFIIMATLLHRRRFYYFAFYMVWNWSRRLTDDKCAILSLQLVELLLQHGADQHLKNSRGVTPRDIAGPQVLDLFLQYGDQQPPAENTPTEGECNTSFAFSPWLTCPEIRQNHQNIKKLGPV